MLKLSGLNRSTTSTVSPQLCREQRTDGSDQTAGYIVCLSSSQYCCHQKYLSHSQLGLVLLKQPHFLIKSLALTHEVTEMVVLRFEPQSRDSSQLAAAYYMTSGWRVRHHNVRQRRQMVVAGKGRAMLVARSNADNRRKPYAKFAARSYQNIDKYIP